MIHSSNFEKGPLLPCKSFHWDATDEDYCLGPTGTPISISSCTLFNSQISKHAAMFRLAARVGRHVAHLTPSPLFFLRISHTFHPSAFSNGDECRSPSALKFGARIKWRQFIRVLMYTCELLNTILLVRPLPESGVTPPGKVCKMHWEGGN